jgi:hypothetical protein
VKNSDINFNNIVDRDGRAWLLLWRREAAAAAAPLAEFEVRMRVHAIVRALLWSRLESLL